MVVGDAAKDDRFRDRAMLIGSCKIRFYAGAPLITPPGHRVGTLAVMDTRPRMDFSDEDVASLTDLAGVAMHELNIQLELAGLRTEGDAGAGEIKFRALMESASQAIIAIDHKGVIELVN